jgi:hypothetical protein
MLGEETLADERSHAAVRVWTVSKWNGADEVLGGELPAPASLPRGVEVLLDQASQILSAIETQLGRTGVSLGDQGGRNTDREHL